MGFYSDLSILTRNLGFDSISFRIPLPACSVEHGEAPAHARAYARGCVRVRAQVRVQVRVRA